MKTLKRSIESIGIMMNELHASTPLLRGEDADREALLLCHSLEKGMGINEAEANRGREKALKLIDATSRIDDRTSYPYRESIAVLSEYISFQECAGGDVSEIRKVARSIGIDLQDHTQCKAGIKQYEKQELLKGTSVDFETFVFSKHSMRDYSFECIKEEEIIKAIELSSRAPSACNRQPCRFLYSLDRTKNEKLSGMIPGNKSFYDRIPYYGLVVADKRFFSPSEFFQWYLNGGIFITYLTMAFHHLGIGSCIFQWPDFYETDKEVRKLCQILPSETIIAAIGYGKYPENAKCLVASRKNTEEISHIF